MKRAQASLLLSLALALAAGYVGARPAAAEEALVLRVNDAAAPAGGLAVVVVRTYASRPVSQGQLRFRMARAPLSPFLELEKVEVWSGASDAIVEGQLGDADGSLVVVMASPSATINAIDGPLAALFLRLREDLLPGQSFPLELDPIGTQLLDTQGAPIALDPRPANLVVLAAGAPLTLQAEGDQVDPGQSAELTVFTARSLPLSEARFDFRYPLALAAGDPQVFVHPAHGATQAAVDLSTPGRVLLEITSLDGAFNQVPGDLVEILLPTRPGLPVGSLWPVWLDPTLTHAIDSDGNDVTLALFGDVVEVTGEVLFADGFESGDLAAWD